MTTAKKKHNSPQKTMFSSAWGLHMCTQSAFRVKKKTQKQIELSKKSRTLHISNDKENFHEKK